MNIIKNLIILCVVCCAAAAPASAYQRDPLRGVSNELSKGFDKIVELINTDGDHAPLIKEMAILAFEKKIEKGIAKKQKNIREDQEEIGSIRRKIIRLRNGDLDDWFYENEPGTIAQKRKKMENEFLATIEKLLAKITTTEKEIVQYTEFQNKIQALKNKS